MAMLFGVNRPSMIFFFIPQKSENHLNYDKTKEISEATGCSLYCIDIDDCLVFCFQILLGFGAENWT